MERARERRPLPEPSPRVRAPPPRTVRSPDANDTGPVRALRPPLVRARFALENLPSFALGRNCPPPRPHARSDPSGPRPQARTPPLCRLWTCLLRGLGRGATPIAAPLPGKPRSWPRSPRTEPSKPLGGPPVCPTEAPGRGGPAPPRHGGSQRLPIPLPSPLLFLFLFLPPRPTGAKGVGASGAKAPHASPAPPMGGA